MPPKLSRSAPCSQPDDRNDDPLDRLLRSARRTATPRVQQWLDALLTSGEKAQDAEVRK
jgi:hypothetical protein